MAVREFARAGRLVVCLAILALTVLAGLLPSPAIAAPSAGCPGPKNITVPTGGSYQIDASACDAFGTNPQDRVVQPAHGTVTIDNASAGLLTYVHNGDSSTSDSFTFEDASGGIVTVNVTILPASSPLAISPATLPTPAVGVSYSQTLTATGGVFPYSYAMSGGSLPPGLVLSPGGVISGTATGAGAYTVTVAVSDSTAGTVLTASKSYSFNVPAPTLQVSPASAAATLGEPFSQQFQTTGGTAPYVYSLSSGSLPSGMSLDSTGLLRGTPTAPGTFGFRIKSKDSTTFSAGGSAFVEENISVTVSVPTISFSPSILTPAEVGRAYSATITASGGSGSFTYAVTIGALPAGLTLSSAGTISGTPTASGAFPFTVTATDTSAAPGPYSGSKAYVLLVGGRTISVSPATLPNGTAGTPYSQTITATGGTPSYRFGVTAGALPTGLTLATNGTLSGTPVASGTYNFTITATDSSTSPGPYTGSQAYTVRIAPPSLSISPPGLPSPVVGVAYSQTLSASGGVGPYSYTSSGVLPPGLSLSSQGVISGTPTGAGTYGFTVTVTDSSPGTPGIGVRAYAVTIATPVLVVSPASPAAGTRGEPYSQQFQTTGGTAPYRYTVQSGDLPPGLSLDGTGLLQGTPTEAGNFSFDLMVQDSTTVTSGSPPSVVSRIRLVINPPPAISLSPSALPPAAVASAYSATITASGGSGPYQFTAAPGTLPPGLTLSSSGIVSGTPTAGGTFSFTVTATDSSAAPGPYSGSKAYSLSVAGPAISISPATLPGGTAGTAYGQALTATGGTPGYSFAVTSGALPAGLTLTSAGVLSGTPTAGGTFGFTVTATDSSTSPGPYAGSRAYALTIAPPGIALSPSSLPGATTGTAYAATVTASGGTAPYGFAVSGGALPPGLTLAAGGTLSGTPTAAGTYDVTIVATDALGFTGARSYQIAVASDPPTATPRTTETLEGQAVTVDVGSGSANVTSAAISTPPANGTASVSGTAITYTPSASFTGTDRLYYTLTGPGGTSAPASLTITVSPRPVASSQQVSTAAATPVTVDLTQNASGGPFTSAGLVALPPASTGTVVLAGFSLTFTPAPGFSGNATVSFTLSNAFATSAAATITITVAERPDPTRDSEVMGLLNAQTAATRRFAGSQIDNFQQRLEALHDFADAGEITEDVAFIQGVTIAADNSCGAFDAVAQAAASCAGIQPAADPLWRDRTAPQGAAAADMSAATGRSSHSRTTVWTGGTISFGDSDGFDFQTTGLSAGIDYRVTRDLVLGVGGGYGRDTSKVGDNGSRSTGSSYTAAVYGSYQPGRHFFFDGVTGYQWLSFDPERYVTTRGSMADGQRDGGQWFASLSAGGKFALDAWRFTPYARLDVARASLDAYTEGGDPFAALHYGQQDINTTTGNLGLIVDYDYVADFGTISPQLRVQYQHDFQGGSEVTMGYADLVSGPFYAATLAGLGQDRVLLGVGLNIQTKDDIALRLEYRGLLGSDGDTDNSVLLNLGASF